MGPEPPRPRYVRTCGVSSLVAEPSLRLSRLLGLKACVPYGTCLFALLRRLRLISQKKKSRFLPTRPPAFALQTYCVCLVSSPVGEPSLRPSSYSGLARSRLYAPSLLLRVSTRTLILLVTTQSNLKIRRRRRSAAESRSRFHAVQPFSGFPKQRFYYVASTFLW